MAAVAAAMAAAAAAMAAAAAGTVKVAVVARILAAGPQATKAVAMLELAHTAVTVREEGMTTVVPKVLAMRAAMMETARAAVVTVAMES